MSKQPSLYFLVGSVFTVQRPLSGGDSGRSLASMEAVAGFVTAEHFSRLAMVRRPDVYLVAPRGSEGLELHIYPNEASIFGHKACAWLEERDVRTPPEFLEALVSECTRSCASDPVRGASTSD